MVYRYCIILDRLPKKKSIKTEQTGYGCYGGIEQLGAARGNEHNIRNTETNLTCAKCSIFTPKQDQYVSKLLAYNGHYSSTLSFC